MVLVSDPRHPSPELGTTFPLAGSAAGEASRRASRASSIPSTPTGGATARRRSSRRYGYGSLVSFPLLFEGQALGTLDIAHPPADGLLDCCFQVARQVAHLVAIALHNSPDGGRGPAANRLLGRENALLKEEIRQFKRDGRYVAESAGDAGVVERVRLAAPSTTTVLIRGETGTGKEGLARMVHEFSPRFNAPFVAGEPRRAARGRSSRASSSATRRGRSPARSGGGRAASSRRTAGTIFLDEVGDAPAVRAGAAPARAPGARDRARRRRPSRVKVDVRVVAATNRDLEERSRAARSAPTSTTGSRSSRSSCRRCASGADEIRPLATHFLARHAAAMHRRPPRVAEDAGARSRRTAGPATCASSRTSSSARSSSRPATSSSLPELPTFAASRLARSPAAAEAPGPVRGRGARPHRAGALARGRARVRPSRRGRAPGPQADDAAGEDEEVRRRDAREGPDR